MPTVIGIHGSHGSLDVTFEPGYDIAHTQLLLHELEAAHPEEKMLTLECFAAVTGRTMTVGPIYKRLLLAS